MAVSAALRRRVLEPAWSRYSGAPLLTATRQLEASQFRSEPELRSAQLCRLRDLLEFVYASNPFYRVRLDQAGLGTAAIESLDELRRIPVLTKAEVRARGSEMMSTGFDRATLMMAKTGGSTGKPIELYFTEEVSQLRNASGRRNKQWAGWRVGEPTGAVWGNPVLPETLRDRLRQWVLAPTISLDTMRVTADSVREFARQWRRVQPTLLFGHAHSLFVVASLIRELEVTEIRPTAIIASSMMLLPHERALIEQVFQVKVTDIYGCEEVGLIAGECERHEGLHMNADQLIVEVLRDDGNPVAPGETGLVVVTDLLNRAMPFIRYRMEDMAELAERSCPCGRGLPTLRRVVGRTADFLQRLDGSRVAGISLIENTLTRIPGIEQMQIVQDTRSHICLNIVPGPAFKDSNREKLTDYFDREFPGTTIDLREVAAIRQEQNGKYRFSICTIPDTPPKTD